MAREKRRRTAAVQAAAAWAEALPPFRQVLDCGGPPPLSLAHPHTGVEALVTGLDAPEAG
jgi:hypothetical protein